MYLAISIPRRAERPARRSGSWRYVVVASIVVAALAGAVALSRSSLFRVREVVVVGASHLSRPEVIRAARIARDTNVLWLDERVVERRLEQRAWIASADVRTVYPRRVEITVVERVPVAVIVRGDRRELIAADGTALGPAAGAVGLPRIAVPSVPGLDGVRLDVRGAATALGAMAPGLRAEVGSVRVGVDGALDLRLRNGVLVRYGRAVEAGRKAAALADVLAWARAEGESLQMVSVVSAELPAVRFAS
jgi:cell division protein FtsQ